MLLIDDLVTENAELQQQLTRAMAVETARREQQKVRQFQHICTYKCVLARGFPLGFSLPHSMSLDFVGCMHSIQDISLLQFTGATATADEEGS